MTVYDLLAGLVLLAFAIAVLLLFGQVGNFLLGALSLRGGRSGRRPSPVETEGGTFTYEASAWHCRHFRGTDLSVHTNDRSGAPDLEFIRGVPDLLAALDELDVRARRFAPDLADGYELDGLLQGDEGVDFLLSYSQPESDSGDGIYIEFAGGEPVGVDVVG